MSRGGMPGRSEGLDERVTQPVTLATRAGAGNALCGHSYFLQRSPQHSHTLDVKNIFQKPVSNILYENTVIIEKMT